jgi:GNAT superfamily N-acetyltransferase
MIVLRDGTDADVAMITQVVQEGFAEYAGKLDPPSGAHRETADTIAAKMAQGGAVMAFVEEKCVGVVLFNPDNGSMYLGRLAVLPAYRAQGVGRALVAAVEQKAKITGLPRIWLGVRLALPRNRAFFEGLGYQIIAYHSHDGYTEPTYMTLEKRLTT